MGTAGRVLTDSDNFGHAASQHQLHDPQIKNHREMPAAEINAEGTTALKMAIDGRHQGQSSKNHTFQLI